MNAHQKACLDKDQLGVDHCGVGRLDVGHLNVSRSGEGHSGEGRSGEGHSGEGHQFDCHHHVDNPFVKHSLTKADLMSERPSGLDAKAIDELEIPADLPASVQQAAKRSGLRYPSFVQQLVSTAFASLTFWQQTDVERLLWLADRLGLDPLAKELIAIESEETFPKAIAFMITLDGWVKLLHRHPRFKGMAFEEGPLDEQGYPLWMSCTLYWEGFTCPWVVKEWAQEHRSLHELWLRYPRRMLRHKALIQCARLALGVGGGWIGGVWSEEAPVRTSEGRGERRGEDRGAQQMTGAAQSTCGLENDSPGEKSSSAKSSEALTLEKTRPQGSKNAFAAPAKRFTDQDGLRRALSSA
jgi:hypothetical protein